MSGRRVYLDYNATAPLRPEAVAAMQRCFAEVQGNASTPYLEGRRARHELQQARLAVARAIGAERDEILFTASGTEANHLAILSSLLAAREQGKNHVIASAIEHPSVLKLLQESPLRELWSLSIAPVSAAGIVSIPAVLALLRPQTALVVVQLVNNEIGTIQPIAELAGALRASGALLVCDAVQGLGRCAIDVRELGAAMLTFSAHKVGGPQGIGALYLRAGTPVAPPLRGGGQELSLRPGTEPVALAAGFAAALQRACDERAAEHVRLGALRTLLVHALDPISKLVEHGDREARVPSTVSVSLPGVDAAALVTALDLDGFAISTGAACSSGAHLPSHVIAAIGSAHLARSTVRISFGYATTADDVRTFAAAFARAVDALHRGRST